MDRKPCYTFRATRAVHSMAPGTPRIISQGDTVNVLGWYCQDGPTALTIENSWKKHCIPFSWVVEAGADEASLRQKMVMM